MKLKSTGLALTLALAAFSGGAYASPRLSLSYEPTEAVVDALEGTAVWAEVHPVPAAKVTAAISRAKSGLPPSDALVAVIVRGELNFQLGKQAIQLAETSTQLTRGRDAISYGSACDKYPLAADRLLTTYAAPDSVFSAELDVRVVKYFSFGDDSDTPLDLTQAALCEKETHSRTFLAGTLRIKKQGRIQQTLPVLMQSVVEPTEP